MNIKEYIESGIIESYVLGSTTPEENEEIEKLAQAHPEIQLEIEANKVAFLEYIMQFQAEPPAVLKDKVLDKLSFLEEKEEEEKIEHEIKRIHTSSNGLFSWMPYLAAACLVLLLVSLGFNVLLYTNWKKAEKERDDVIAQKDHIFAENKILETSFDQANEELAILKNPANIYVELNSVIEEIPEAKVSLIWNSHTKDVYLQINDLPKPPPGKQYQLWSVDGDVVEDAGVFDTEEEKVLIQKMKNVPRANTFIVTLEKEGGVPVAEGQPYVKGDV